MMMLRNIVGQDILYFVISSFLLLLNGRAFNCFFFCAEYLEGCLLSLCNLKFPFMGLLLSV